MCSTIELVAHNTLKQVNRFVNYREEKKFVILLLTQYLMQAKIKEPHVPSAGVEQPEGTS